MENAYNKAMPFLSDAKNSTGSVSNATGDFVNAGELEKYLPMATKLFQQTRGLQSELVQQQEDSLQDGGFFFRNEQASRCRTNSIKELGTMPEMKMTQAMDKKKQLPQMPPKNILFEACMTNQPLNASLREPWSTGTYYFLK